MKGLTKVLEENYKNVTVRVSFNAGVSSIRRGNHLDKCDSHFVNCVYSQRTCTCSGTHKHLPVNLKLFHKDAAHIGLSPLCTQLIVSSPSFKFASAADNVFVTRAGELVFVERKSGYVGALDTPLQSKYCSLPGPLCHFKDTWRNRHALQAALTAYMLKKTYNRQVVGVYVCYTDHQIDRHLWLHSLHLKNTILEWVPVHKMAWYPLMEQICVFLEKTL